MPLTTRRRTPDRWAGLALVAVPLVLFALLPVLLAALISGPASSSYAAEVEVVEPLAATEQGKLEFLLVESRGGRAPAERFVITVDRDYTAGLGREIPPGDRFWVEGTLMDRQTYFGEQYLFFGYPQLYVSQMKSGGFWPSQLAGLRDLYSGPLLAVASLYFVGALPFMEEYSLSAWLWTWARFVVTVAAVVLVILWRRRPVRVAQVVASYLLAAMLLAVPAAAG